MCGIVGYLGYREAYPVIISALKRLEYRGYDSWGVAISDEKELQIQKKVGTIGDIKFEEFSKSTIGIGHTRWATHGKPSEINAHPHIDCNGDIAVVHNGIIENYLHLKNELTKRGHKFVSETDTEIIAHLIESKNGNLEDAVLESLSKLKGSYAIAVISSKERKIVAARYKSPLILGVGDEEYFLASDSPAILEYTNRVVYLEDGDMVVITDDGFEIRNNGVKVERPTEVIPWSLADAEKGGYEHFMLKEIHETPRVIEETIAGHISETIELDVSFAAGVSEMIFVACGTSFHAALLGKYIVEEMAGIPVRVEYASEFNYHPVPLSRSLVIGITQSGETADTLEALRKAKSLGARILAITNVLGSSVTRIADYVIYTRAGPEIGVAATKTFIAQLVAIYLIAAKLSMLPRKELENFIFGMRMMPEKIRSILDSKEKIMEISETIADRDNMMYVGRCLGFPVALEGALKMKEISYIHAEGYPAGELKHGPFALLGEKTPVVACVIRDETYDITLSNIKEIKARESPVIAIAEEGDEEIEKYVDYVIKAPKVDRIFIPVTYSVILQLLAYYTARKRGCEIDKPRHLAKSVTVE
ncbi:MAG TPA: glutamine--fructose-6-phosphate transaminase (isomerizing) [Archaeoglobaceae archaeon]|nr:glutamine--fructose-6-phosphate transaminase (isomerizing) [Archaeoglobaceae archaeon]